MRFVGGNFISRTVVSSFLTDEFCFPAQSRLGDDEVNVVRCLKVQRMEATSSGVI